MRRGLLIAAILWAAPLWAQGATPTPTPPGVCVQYAGCEVAPTVTPTSARPAQVFSLTSESRSATPRVPTPRAEIGRAHH